jgi:hypothetical protein
MYPVEEHEDRLYLIFEFYRMPSFFSQKLIFYSF